MNRRSRTLSLTADISDVELTTENQNILRTISRRDGRKRRSRRPSIQVPCALLLKVNSEPVPEGEDLKEASRALRCQCAEWKPSDAGPMSSLKQTPSASRSRVSGGHLTYRHGGVPLDSDRSPNVGGVASLQVQCKTSDSRFLAGKGDYKVGEKQRWEMRFAYAFQPRDRGACKGPLRTPELGSSFRPSFVSTSVEVGFAAAELSYRRSGNGTGPKGARASCKGLARDGQLSLSRNGIRSCSPKAVTVGS